jgi:LEA14-like dessication related protein
MLTIVFLGCANIQPCTIEGLESPKVNQLSRNGIDAELFVRIKNPNHVSVVIYPSKLDGSINGISIGNIHLAKKVRIKTQSNEVQSFHIKSDFSKLGLEDITKILSIISSKSATISIKGEIKVGKWYYRKKIPVEMTKTISLSK